MKIPHIIQQHQRYLTPLLRAVTAAAGLAVGSAQAVNLATSYSENFDSMGTAGTAAPAGWTFFSIGSSSGTWTEATGIPASTVSGGTANATLVVATPPTASSGTQGFNGGLAASPADRALVTAPTGTNGSALQLSVTNTSGGALNGFYLGYDTRRFTAASAANELPGYWLFYSLDSGATWTNVAALNPTLASVPNTAGVTTTDPTLISFSSALANAASVLLRWVDDNAVQSSPDQILGLDNVLISIADPNLSLANIKTFTFGAYGPASISGSNITLYVPDGTDVTALAPTFTLSTGATCDHDNGGPTTYNFTSPQTYQVTSADSSTTKAYLVTIIFRPVITTSSTTLDVSTAATGADILHNAVVVSANHLGGGAVVPVTLDNGLAFGTSQTYFTSGWSFGGQNTDTDYPASTNDAYRHLMGSYKWTSNTTHTLDIPGLTPGHTYRLQMISHVDPAALVSIEAVAVGSWSGANRLLTATWVQSPGDTVANIVLTRAGGSEVHFNGYALHDLSVLPLAPTDLAPTPLVGDIRLTWTPAAGTGSYNVKRSTTSKGPYTPIGTATSPLFNDTAVTNGMTYYYVVSSVNIAGESLGNSNEVSASPTVTKADQTVTFNLGLSVNKTAIDAAFADVAAATSLLPVTYSVNPADAAVAAVDPDSGLVTILRVPGTARILANQAGNAAFNPAPEVEQLLTVSQVMPVVTWATPRAVAAGTALSSTQLNATCTVPGTFTYTPDVGEVLPLGSNTLSVHFAPAEPVTYGTPADKTVTLTVGTPDGPTLVNVNYGTAANASMNGIYSFDPTARGSASQPAPAAYGGNVWNDFGGDTGSSNLLDSFGTASGIGLSWGPGAVSSPYNDWNGLGTNRLLVSGRFLATTSYAAVFTLSGLNSSHKYGLYVASLHNTESNSIDFQAVGAASTVLHCQYASAAGWVAGQDYVYFADQVPAADGTLVVNAQRPGSGYFNGFQLVDLGGSASADYQAWAAGSFAAAFSDTDPTHDPDGDGLTNQQEYAFGLDPTTGASVNPITVQLNKASGLFSYTRRATPPTTGLAYAYQWSATLHGDWLGFTPDSAVSNSGSPVEVITVKVPAALLLNRSLFVRVSAVPAP